MRRAVWMLAAAAAVAAPCWWQKRIFAGDLSSHIYNAWLAQLIERGEAPGLVFQPLYTNIAFDWLLAWLLNLIGPDLAQRVAVSVVVLVFSAGVWMLLTTLSKRPPVFLFPFIAILSHGWVYHAGFFNYMASLGLSLAGFALVARRQSIARWAGAAALSIVAALAHPYPLAAVVALGAYWFVARAIHPRRRWWLLAASMLLILAFRQVLLAHFQAGWLTRQYICAFGADQLWVFGPFTYALVAACLIVWRFLYYRVGRFSVVEVLRRVPAQLTIIAAAAALLIPTQIGSTGDKLGFTYVAERTSLIVAVLVLVFFARIRPTRFDLAACWALALCFYVVIFAEGARLNAIEDRVDRTVARLPAGSRVVSTRGDESANTDQIVHMVDRACLGHCYSFANYEPGTAAFRIRVDGDSPLVARDYATSAALQAGRFGEVRSRWPYYVLRITPEGHVTIEQ